MKATWVRLLHSGLCNSAKILNAPCFRIRSFVGAPSAVRSGIRRPTPASSKRYATALNRSVSPRRPARLLNTGTDRLQPLDPQRIRHRKNRKRSCFPSCYFPVPVLFLLLLRSPEQISVSRCQRARHRSADAQSMSGKDKNATRTECRVLASLSSLYHIAGFSGDNALLAVASPHTNTWILRSEGSRLAGWALLERLNSTTRAAHLWSRPACHSERSPPNPFCGWDVNRQWCNLLANPLLEYDVAVADREHGN